MATIDRLNDYSKALTKWADKKRSHDIQIEAGKKPKKELESEPMPAQFEIGKNEIEWAEKIRRKVLTPKPPIASLDSMLPPKTIKMPVRKI
jgi:hypothetical protein